MSSSFSSKQKAPANGSATRASTSSKPSTSQKRKLPEAEQDDDKEEQQQQQPGVEAHRIHEKPQPETQEHKSPEWRAVEFFHEMIRDAPAASPKYKSLDARQKRIFALGVRNLFLATATSPSAVRDRDKQILQGMLNVVDGDEEEEGGEASKLARVQDGEGSGLIDVSFHPSATYSHMRRVQDLDVKIGEHPHRNYFAQLGAEPRVFAAFVRPDAGS